MPVPTGDLPGFRNIFWDDFNQDAPLGSWASATEAETVVYVGLQGQKWYTYPETFKDTYDARPYRSGAVLSVHDSVLDFWLHQVNGMPAGANPSPVLPSGSQYQTYGRYSIRLKVNQPDLSEYLAVPLLWPENDEVWPADGEENWPDNLLVNPVYGHHHYARPPLPGEGPQGGQDEVRTTAKFTDWHTYTIEWTPGRVKYLLDDVVVLNSTEFVPHKPMRWQLQIETKGQGNHSGHLLVDWVSVWAYQP